MTTQNINALPPRFFNTTGPIAYDMHYYIPPLERFDLDEIILLIRQRKYFVIHAPRQTGKTTYLQALAQYLNESGAYHCLYVNVEGGYTAGSDVYQGMQSVLGELALKALMVLNDPFIDQQWRTILDKSGPHVALQEVLMKETIQEDIQYVLDLGLIRREPHGIEMANAIYREVIPRELTATIQENLTKIVDPVWYLAPTGYIDMTKLLTGFQEFFRQHSEHWVERFRYKEAGVQLLLHAFLQRIVNGGGRIEREYGLGSKRTDLLVVWHVGNTTQKIVLKLLHHTLEKTQSEGLKQTWEYMDKSGTNEGHLVLFDRTPDKPWEEKISMREETYAGHTIRVWGM